MAYYNRGYGRCSEGKITEYAPSPLKWEKTYSRTVVDGTTGETSSEEVTERKNLLHPTEQECNDMGWYLIVGNSPEHREGCYSTKTGVEMDGNRIVNVYEYTKIEPSVNDYNMAVETFLKDERVAHGYDTREPSMYINSSVERWRQDAVDWIAHVDEVMTYALGVLNEWKLSGIVPPMKDFISGIPRISWTFKDEE